MLQLRNAHFQTFSFSSYSSFQMSGSQNTSAISLVSDSDSDDSNSGGEDSDFGFKVVEPSSSTITTFICNLPGVNTFADLEEQQRAYAVAQQRNTCTFHQDGNEEQGRPSTPMAFSHRSRIDLTAESHQVQQMREAAGAFGRVQNIPRIPVKIGIETQCTIKSTVHILHIASPPSQLLIERYRFIKCSSLLMLSLV